MKKQASTLLALGIASVLAACGGNNPETKTPASSSGGPAKPTEAVSVEAENKFKAAMDSMNAHDKAADWSDEVCAEVAKAFEAAAAETKSGKFPEAIFNSGLAFQRCGNDKEARARFEKTLQQDNGFHHAKVQLALYKFKADQNEDGVIAELQQAVLDAKFQNVPALVNLAAFQMQRDGAAGGQGCKDDMECAKQNLQRALAIDDAYMPAFNQLALYYFQGAKKRAGAIKSSQKGNRGRQIATNAALGKRADVQQLELAALVCSQAIRKNPSYAPIHNTAGLLQNELGQVNSAVSEFGMASKLDPKFFEAHMNFAAVNLSFRGFEQALSAYKKALEMRPNDYDAHLGLALALRGLINDGNYDAQVAAVQAELDACKKIDAARPDAYYNEGILTQEYKAKAGGTEDKIIATYEQAINILKSFMEKAAGKPEYEGAVKRSKERIQDMEDLIQFAKLKVAPEPGAAPAPAPAPGAAPAAAPPADKK
jgi:tetratricopeptide (TPR) repeat protein